jgi:chitin synthase
MADARRVYRYVQGTSEAPSAYGDDDDYRDYEEDYDDDDDDFDPQGPIPPASGHSPSGSSKTLQYAAASAGHSPSGGSKTLQYAMAPSSRPPGLATFDTITEAVNKLQSRYSSPSSSIPNVAPSHPTVREPTPPYERPPSTASSASSFTVATDYAAPLKIGQGMRSGSTTRPPSHQPPSLPTIDSGQPLQWDTLNFIEEQDDPFSDRPPSRQRATPPYPFQVHQRHSSNSSSSRSHGRDVALAGGMNYPPRPPSQLSAGSTRSASSTRRGPSPAPSAGPPILQVMQLHSPSQEEFFQPTVGLISRPGSAQPSQYNSFHSQALTPPANRMLQRRSPAKALSPVDHFRHDTEAYASGRDSLPAFAIPRSRSPTPAPPDDGYEAASMVNGHFTGTTQPADTHYTGSQYTEETVGIDGGDEDGESTDGEEDEKKVKEKPKPKSKFQEYLAKARTQALLDPEPEEKPTPQNIFADPRRVVFPIGKSMMFEDSDVPGSPVETRHFGPAPPGRVARRNKTTKRVPLTNGNLVLDLPVPPKLVLPRVGHPEVEKTRYTAVTCDPDDFEKSGHFLRQNQMNRRTELFICITMYNVCPFLSMCLLERNS